ncbi:vWA domain-containing protein [Nocardioides bruguierae]|uniref:vWA domain-containing protein n=1 Tax=Nocardioides bruguierae TaxID=2945102 RepID=UPI00202023A7|nr:VWA domain-containing protein [Nocardioides bruguierae]MCL8027608.1 VWA domain-containing protein [Nocardioides bruguierae]
MLIVRRLLLAAAVLGLALGLGQRDAVPPADPLELDVVVVLDRTTSMAAADAAPSDDSADGQTRVAAALADVEALAAALPGVRVAVVTVGEEATLRAPFTTDAEGLQRQLDQVLVEEPFSGTGSTLATGTDLVADLLARAPATGEEPARTAVVLLSDGEQTAPAATARGTGEAWAALADDVDAALVLGYGTREGATMPADAGRVPPLGSSPDAGTDAGTDATTDRAAPAAPLIDPATGQAAVTRYDPDVLDAVADALDGTVEHRTTLAGMPDLATALAAEAIGDPDAGTPGRGTLWWWALAVALLALPEVLRGTRRALDRTGDAP